MRHRELLQLGQDKSVEIFHRIAANKHYMYLTLKDDAPRAKVTE